MTATYDDGAGGLAIPTDLVVRHGDRLVLTAASGAGKTTFAEVLAGERAPTTGTLVVAEGVEVVRVLQAGDDHLFQASLLFNVACGGSWPPDEDDVELVEQLLDELGLAPLVAAMPGGLAQPIGDGGWRLSSGEAARVSLARALVRRPDVLILDETTAALDAAARDLVLAASVHSCATIVIAHI